MMVLLIRSGNSLRAVRFTDSDEVCRPIDYTVCKTRSSISFLLTSPVIIYNNTAYLHSIKIVHGLIWYCRICLLSTARLREDSLHLIEIPKEIGGKGILFCSTIENIGNERIEVSVFLIARFLE